MSELTSTATEITKSVTWEVRGDKEKWDDFQKKGRKEILPLIVFMQCHCF